MPLEAQTRLLRVLQEGEYTTVGGRRPIRADVRIIAATHRDLRHHVQQGLFREDLFYRLNVVPIRLPPLRERTEDIPELAQHFFAQVAVRGAAAQELLDRGDGAAEALSLAGQRARAGEPGAPPRRAARRGRDRPRGGRGRARRARCRASPTGRTATTGSARRSSGICSEYFSAHGDALPSPGLYDRVLREIERPLFAVALSATRGNQIRAAKLLGLNRNTLRKKIRDLDIPVVRGVK